MFRSITFKFILIAVMLVTMTVLMLGLVVYQRGTQHLVDNALSRFSLDVHDKGQQINFHIETMSDDIRLLSAVIPVKPLMFDELIPKDNRQVEHKALRQALLGQVEDIFADFMRAKPAYIQVRLIDLDGMELVRVNGLDGHATVIEASGLQDKHSRDYVAYTLDLDRGETFLSPINLNREHGQVEVPHREVVRISTPVFDEKDNVAGLVIITSDMAHEFTYIQDAIRESGEEVEVYITDEQGSYLVHPDERKEYGFDLGRPYRIQEDFPKVAPFYLPENIDKKFILQPESDVENAMVFTKVPIGGKASSRYIIVGVGAPYGAIIAAQQEIIISNSGYLIIILLAAIIMAAIFASLITRPIRKVTAAIDEFLHGGDTIELDVERGDEIGQLASSFVGLRREVQISQQALRELNDRLEAEVVQRTAALDVSHRHLSSVLENMIDGVIIIDERAVIQSVNGAAEKIFGYGAAEMIGQNVKMLMPEPYHGEHDGYLDNYLNTGNARVIGVGREVEGLRKNGESFPLDLAVSKVSAEDDNEDRLFAGIVRDITERKRVEKMKNEFVSTVSHELRTPLTSIKGSLGLVLGGAAGIVSEKVKELLIITSNNTERLLMLINDILDIQKIESGKMVFNFRNISLTTFLEKAIEDNQGYANIHHIEFRIKHVEADIFVFADGDRLMQVMANLMSNAAKFSPEGDRVELSISRHGNDRARITVTDYGPGIPEAFQSHIFEKFSQYDSSDTRKTGSSGLGLSIARLIVEKHGGQIGFITREEVGTTFWIELPISSAHFNGDVLPVMAKERRSCVLIIEDDPDIAILLQRMLMEAGFNADIAYDIAQARLLLAEYASWYRVITLDLMLPDGDGISFAAELKNDPKLQSIPLVVVSVKADEAKRELSGQILNIVDWLSKPIDQKRLIEAVKLSVGEDRLPNVLHVEDDVDVHHVVELILKDKATVTWASTLEDSREQLRAHDFDMVLLDIGLPDGSGLDLLPMINACRPQQPRVIIFSAQEVSREILAQVDMALVKSNVSGDELLNAIIKVVRTS